MGYTNYWHQYNDFTDDQWKEIKEEYEYVKEVCANIIDDETVTTDEIIFNGKDKNGHETFLIKQNARSHDDKRYPEEDVSFNFCKTAMKPYDIAVWHMLTFINRINPSFSISRDR